MASAASVRAILELGGADCVEMRFTLPLDDGLLSNADRVNIQRKDVHTVGYGVQAEH
jgi:hypothetical protein